MQDPQPDVASCWDWTPDPDRVTQNIIDELDDIEHAIRGDMVTTDLPPAAPGLAVGVRAPPGQPCPLELNGALVTRLATLPSITHIDLSFQYGTADNLTE